MGSPKNELGRFDDEAQVPVELTRGFWMGKYPGTQSEYGAVTGANPSVFKGDRLPVESVDWDEACEFCRRLTARELAAGTLPDGWEYRLPTEAQWEYACRAGTTTALNSGQDLTGEDRCAHVDEVAWYRANSGGQTHAVGGKRANAWGLHDMHGNVWEWCADWYDDYASGPVVDPSGPPSGAIRVDRGGSWRSDAGGCRSASRFLSQPASRRDDLGLRPALVPSGGQDERQRG